MTKSIDDSNSATAADFESPSISKRTPQHEEAITASVHDAPMSPSMYDESFEDAPVNQGLLNKKRKRLRPYFSDAKDAKEWLRPYWLGSSLFLLLFAFWILDSLKDPLFARLVDGHIETHQPTAKIISVVATLIIVCGMEYLANHQQRITESDDGAEHPISSEQEILEPGGIWQSSIMYSQEHRQQQRAVDDKISISIFYQIGVPYMIAFLLIGASVLHFETIEDTIEDGFDGWYVLAYTLHATVESFGSITVATFWSFTNSSLCLADAELYYGPIIALAQLGAIGGSTLVASGRWHEPSLLVVVSLVIGLQMLVMNVYNRKFLPTSILAKVIDDDDRSILTWQDNDASLTKPFWSGLYLIFNHYYVFLILGVSCLYEITLTCLDYQMKLLGYAKFATTQMDSSLLEEISSTMSKNSPSSILSSMSFAEFMGRYGQMVNVLSLIFSSLIFPFLIRRLGLKATLRVFPTLLLIITIIAYGALPGNLTVLFISLSLLKAMTYSLHDPSKELLYIPTSNAVKFRAKFWIDVVGERISKAIGGIFNTFSGSVEKSIQIGSLPSILSAAGLWFVCYYVGIEFDRLLRTGTIVGLDHKVDPSTYREVSRIERDDKDDEDDGDGGNNTKTDHLYQDQPFDVQIGPDDSFSTLGLDTLDEDGKAKNSSSPFIELPPRIVRL